MKAKELRALVTGRTDCWRQWIAENPGRNAGNITKDELEALATQWGLIGPNTATPAPEAEATPAPEAEATPAPEAEATPAPPADTLATAALAAIGRGDVAAFRTMIDRAEADARDAGDALASANAALAEAEAALANAPAPAAAGGDTAGTAPRRPTPRRNGTETLGALFGLRGTAWRTRTASIWAGATDAPAVDPDYVWHPDTGLMLAMLAHGSHLFLYGPAGTGKTSWAEQVAAKTGRPFCHVTLNAVTEAADVLGQLVPAAGGVRWQDGVLTQALRRPGTLILLDEVSNARPGLVSFLLEILGPTRAATLPDGQCVAMADGVVMLAADNTNGTGDATGAYQDRRVMDRALLDRFSLHVGFDYLDQNREARVIEARTKCPARLADALADYAARVRVATVNGELTHAIGLRRLTAWAEALVLGAKASTAFDLAVVASQAPDDVESLRQIRRDWLSDAAVTALAKGETPPETGDNNNNSAPEFEPVTISGRIDQ